MVYNQRSGGRPAQDFNPNAPVGSGNPISRSGPVIPTQDNFKQAHQQSDVDSEPGAQHHTLGFGGNQAFPGNAFPSKFNELFKSTLADYLNDRVTVALKASVAFNSGTNPLVYDDVKENVYPSKETQGSISYTGGTFTCVRSGTFEINAGVRYSSPVGATLGSYRSLYLTKTSGTIAILQSLGPVLGGGLDAGAYLTYIMPLVAGDNINLWFLHNAPGPVTVYGDAFLQDTYCQVSRRF